MKKSNITAQTSVPEDSYYQDALQLRLRPVKEAQSMQSNASLHQHENLCSLCFDPVVWNNRFARH